MVWSDSLAWKMLIGTHGGIRNRGKRWSADEKICRSADPSFARFDPQVFSPAETQFPPAGRQKARIFREEHGWPCSGLFPARIRVRSGTQKSEKHVDIVPVLRPNREVANKTNLAKRKARL